MKKYSINTLLFGLLAFSGMSVKADMEDPLFKISPKKFYSKTDLNINIDTENSRLVEEIGFSINKQITVRGRFGYNLNTDNDQDDFINPSIGGVYRLKYNPIIDIHSDIIFGIDSKADDPRTAIDAGATVGKRFDNFTFAADAGARQYFESDGMDSELALYAGAYMQVRFDKRLSLNVEAEKFDSDYYETSTIRLQGNYAIWGGLFSLYYETDSENSTDAIGAIYNVTF